VQVACEEMAWLPFYPTAASGSTNASHEHGQSSSVANVEAINLVLDQCLLWINHFLKYCTWVQQPPGARALSFLLRW
jgi:hypothetical protein